MRFSVKVHPKSKKKKVIRLDESHYEVWVNEPPDKGRANEAVREALAVHLGVAKSRISVILGKASRQKIVEMG